MAFTFDYTAGGPTANSFISLSDAKDYIAGSIDQDAWNELSDTQRQQHLVTASRMLNIESYSGIKQTTSQALEWPRTGIVDHYGKSVTGVPQRLKDAVCELVLWNLKDKMLDQFELESLTSYKVGPLDLGIKAGAYKKLPLQVTELLKGIGPGAYIGEQKSWNMSR